MLSLVTSKSTTGFTQSGRLATLHWRNEADSGSLALRLTRSLHRASTTRSLQLPPVSLPGERAITRATSSQVTRSARLILALRRDADGLLRFGGATSNCCCPRFSAFFSAQTTTNVSMSVFPTARPLKRDQPRELCGHHAIQNLGSIDQPVRHVAPF